MNITQKEVTAIKDEISKHKLHNMWNKAFTG